ncbi:MAG: M14 family zinc carboxypeptidase [Bacteroidota bacterium]|nr:M14 family zinc carboxypeptidase [Bacteroidota bacterium]
MNKLISLFITLSISAISLAQDNHIKATVETGQTGFELFQQHDIQPVHGFLKKSGTFEGVLHASDIEKLNQSNIPYQIEIDDLESFYKNPQRKSTRIQNVHPCFGDVEDYPVPENFSQGSMGGYYTYSEVLAELDNMANLFPEIITSKTQIESHESIEGRPIYYLKISDNPSMSEDEPQALYTAIHHSQEPASIQQLIFYMYYLLENYETNAEVQYIVDNTELYFIPVINPDGYVYNENENPDGGGLWRKNRRENEGWLAGYGVDLNRNYDYAFAWDGIGSSDIGQHPWHRGDSAFSEPETQAVKDFLESHNILLDLNWHTYGEMLIYPWNYESHNTNDSTFYDLLSKDMTKENHYRFGTCYETYGYQSNGDADDWGYGETDTKNKIISLTGECGNGDDGFWPSPDRIIDICLGTIRMNLELAHYAGHYTDFTDMESDILSQSTGHLNYKIQAVGLSAPSVFTVSMTALTDNISFGDERMTPEMELMDFHSDSIAYTITATSGESIAYVINIDNGNYVYRDTIYKYFGNVDILFTDDCESMTNWDADDWGICSEETYSGNYSITESPDENYGSLQTSEISPTQNFDLSEYSHAVVQFYTKYDIENNYDWVQFFVSNDGGDNWEALCGRHTTIGSDDEEEGEPVYHNFTQGWVFEEISLVDYLGETIQVKFRFKSDQNNTRKGFYFDNFKILGLIPQPVASEIISKSDFVVYPNPAQDVLTIQRGNHSQGTFQIFTLHGKKLSETKLNNAQENISISSLKNGLYLYVYQSETATFQGKISVGR